MGLVKVTSILFSEVSVYQEKKINRCALFTSKQDYSVFTHKDKTQIGFSHYTNTRNE